MSFDFDSILTAKEVDVPTLSEYCQRGTGLPDHTTAMKGWTPGVASDDVVVVGVVLMFCVLAAVFYGRDLSLRTRLKELFTDKRSYAGDEMKDFAQEPLRVFLLISVSALSLSLIFFDDRVVQWDLSAWAGMPYWLFGAGYVVCIALIYAKAWMYMSINWTFFDAEKSQRWLKNYLLTTSLSAFLFYPIALVDVFYQGANEIVTWGAILVLILYEMLLFYQFIMNFKTKKYGYLLNILYFCSVELMPALVLWTYGDWLNHHFIIQNLLY